MQFQSSKSFRDIPLEFDEGVAAIDVITIKGAGNAIEPYISTRNIVLPPSVEYDGLATFEDLMTINLKLDGPNSPSVTAIIDTGKMTWQSELSPRKSSFDDYTQTPRRGVSFKKVRVVNHKKTSITRLPVILKNGRHAYMWFAEVEQKQLAKNTVYGLFAMAKELTGVFQSQDSEQYDRVIIPAQQIEYTRILQEVLRLNPSLLGAYQEFRIALDETGARVYTKASMMAGALPWADREPKVAMFGSKGPVLFWLTEGNNKQGLTPFAVVATTSEAWLEPNQEIDFSLGL